jgi:DNA-binding IclR family transcriptional regulator
MVTRCSLWWFYIPVTDKKLQCQQKRGTLGSAGIRDIPSMTGFPSTLVRRIAATRVKRQYFSQDAVTKNYSLSLWFLERKADYEDLIL